MPYQLFKFVVSVKYGVLTSSLHCCSNSLGDTTTLKYTLSSHLHTQFYQYA